jgi:hypothetical protein
VRKLRIRRATFASRQKQSEKDEAGEEHSERYWKLSLSAR